MLHIHYSKSKPQGDDPNVKKLSQPKHNEVAALIWTRLGWDVDGLWPGANWKIALHYKPYRVTPGFFLVYKGGPPNVRW